MKEYLVEELKRIAKMKGIELKKIEVVPSPATSKYYDCTTYILNECYRAQYSNNLRACKITKKDYENCKNRISETILL